MKPILLALLATPACLSAAPAHAFCIYNGLKTESVAVTVLSTKVPKPPRLYTEHVAAGKDSCCNPRNAECNPESVADTAFVPFEIHVEKPNAPCGGTVRSQRSPTGVEALVPARGSLRIEANPAFVTTRPAALDNAPYLAKVSPSPEPGSPVTYFYSCVAR